MVLQNPRTKSVDFTRRTVWPYAGREGLLFWTLITVTDYYTYPEQTPITTGAAVCCTRYVMTAMGFCAGWSLSCKCTQFSSPSRIPPRHLCGMTAGGPGLESQMISQGDWSPGSCPGILCQNHTAPLSIWGTQ